MNDRVVIIPTYNEKENIENILRYVFKLEPKFDVLVIEDNSPDGTAQIVKRLQSEFPQLHMIERKGRLGLGTAYITGFKWSLEHGYNYIFEMDADFSHNPDDLVKLYHACESGEGDMAIGSRYVTGVNVVNWPMGRVLMSYFASKYVRFITGMKVHDAIHSVDPRIQAERSTHYFHRPYPRHIQNERRHLQRGFLGCHHDETQELGKT